MTVFISSVMIKEGTFRRENSNENCSKAADLVLLVVRRKLPFLEKLTK